MIYANSRYADTNRATISNLETDDGKIQTVVFRDSTPYYNNDYYVYTWKKNDRIDLVAQYFLSDGSKWWLIMDMNPHLTNPANISAGEYVRIPRV